MIDRVLVSIAIPAHNPKLFRQALGSVLGQDYADLQVIVCDDSQGEQVSEIFEELIPHASVQSVYLRNERNLGFARSLQKCLEYATGQYIKFLCDDDMLVSSCVGRQAAILINYDTVSLVTNQRVLCDVDNLLLPSRPVNFIMSPGSAIIHGGDLLEIIADSAMNPLGGISHSMFRTETVRSFMPTLVQDGQGFIARLDLALYLCALRRGHLACLEEVLSIERLHAGQFSHRAGATLAFKAETQWLLQMLAQRTNEAAPAKGWMRCVDLVGFQDKQGYSWQEFEMGRLYTAQAAECQQQIGTTAMTFAQVYDDWLSCRTLSIGQLSVLPKRLAQWPRRPKIIPVIMAANSQPADLRVTLDSVRSQSYKPSSIWILNTVDHHQVRYDDPITTYIDFKDSSVEALSHALTTVEDDTWILLLQAGDRIQEHGLVILAERMALRNDCTCLYMDEGTYDDLESTAPIFKPDFNLDLMRSFPYVGRLLAFKCATIREVGGLGQTFGGLWAHDLLWRMVEERGLHAVEHIPEVLVQCRVGFSEFLSNPEYHMHSSRVVEAHLQRSGVQAQVQNRPGTLISRVMYQLDSTSLVSVLINAGNDLDVLTRCVRSILESTDFPSYEIVLISNGSEPAQVRDWLLEMQACGSTRLHVVTVTAQHQAQSFNEAAHSALGDFLVLLDTACVAFDRQWLNELVSQAQRPEVGIVGPMICDGHGKVSNAGLVLGMRGTAGTAFAGCMTDTHGYLGRLQLVQNWSAVGLECLVIRRSLFLSLHGLDVQRLQVELFDVDLCLRVKAQGYLVVWTPFAKMGCLAQAQSDPHSERARLQDRELLYERWMHWVAKDPAFNPNLSLRLSGFQMEPGKRHNWNPFIKNVLPSVMAVPINMGAVGHYRVVQPFTELEKAGWIQGGLHYGMPEAVELARQQPETVILQCRYGVNSIDDFKEVKRSTNARLIYELDDYIIDVPQKNAHARNMPGNMRELVHKGIALSDRVVVSTQPLADALSGMHADIRVVPNMLAESLWNQLKSDRYTSKKPRVGWAGGSSHRGDLELILDVVKALADEVDWVFFGMCPDLLRPYVKEFHEPVSLPTYPQKLASLNLDLALAPLEINLFNDCKSNLRLLEYGACGFPVICTDTKAYRGYLPCTRVANNETQEWIEAIRMHLDDRDANARQGDALREVVLRDYVLTQDNLQLWANAWLAD